MADSGKLYYLRDRARRPAGRHPRRRTEGAAAVDTNGRSPVSRETLWLSRILVAEAAYLVLWWAGVGVGVVALPEHPESRLWTYSFLPADFLVAAISGLAAWELVRRSEKRDVVLVLAAGGLVFLSLSRLTHGIASSFVSAMTPGQRLQVTLMGVCLYVGLWAASYALRTKRSGE